MRDARAAPSMTFDAMRRLYSRRPRGGTRRRASPDNPGPDPAPTTAKTAQSGPSRATAVFRVFSRAQTEPSPATTRSRPEPKRAAAGAPGHLAGPVLGSFDYDP